MSAVGVKMDANHHISLYL